MNRQPPKKMPKPHTLPLFSYRLLLFFAEILIFFFCIGFVDLIYTNDILPDKMVKEDYPETACVVVSKKLSEHKHLLHRYRADFLVNYTVNGTPFESWATGNGLDQAFYHDRAAQVETLAEFDIGSSYPCWYNPQNPQIAVLVMRHGWSSTLPLIIPTAIGLIALYYLLKNIFQFFGLLVAANEKETRFKK